MARRGERVAALGIPAVDVATVSDAAFRTLNVIGFLYENERVTDIKKHRTYKIRKTGFQFSPKYPAYEISSGKVAATSHSRSD